MVGPIPSFAPCCHTKFRGSVDDVQVHAVETRVQDLPVVMMTMVDDRSRGMALGADDFLVKPITRERLLKLMSKFRR